MMLKETNTINHKEYLMKSYQLHKIWDEAHHGKNSYIWTVTFKMKIFLLFNFIYLFIFK
jgi:hypothetical protein